MDTKIASLLLVGAIIVGLLATAGVAASPGSPAQNGTPPTRGDEIAAQSTTPIPEFCDSSSDHGSSKSCKGEAEATGAVCPNGGIITSTGCSVGQSCNEGGQSGHYCNCTITCTTTGATVVRA